MKDMECSADTFLRKKFGKDRMNGNGIRRLLLEYRDFLNNTWVPTHDDSGQPTMEYLIRQFGLDQPNRKYPFPDQKIYVAVYSHTVLFRSVSDICTSLGMTSGSVSQMLNNWAKKELYKDKKFVEHIAPITDRFGELIQNTDRSVRLISKRYRK
jgi:hypothetical protein